MNMDRIVLNGDQMIVFRTNYHAAARSGRPAFEDRFNRSSIGSSWTNVNGGHWGIYGLMWQNAMGSTTWYKQVTTVSSEDNYTAEFHMKQMNRET